MSNWLKNLLGIVGLFLLTKTANANIIPNTNFALPSDGEVIVETQNLDELQNFTSQYGLEIKPLMDSKIQTQEAIDAFKQYQIITIPRTLQDSTQKNLVSRLMDLPHTIEVKSNECPYTLEREESSNRISSSLPDTSLDNPERPNDPLYDQQWDKEKIQCPYVWGADITGQGVVIAILDSGVDTDHEDLKDNLIPGKTFIGSSCEDNYGHGTRASGVAAEVGNNNKGGAGVAYKASIMPIKVTNNQGNFEDWDDIINAITWAADNGANILNMSYWRDQGEFYAAEYNALNYAYNKGVSLISISGNDNKNAKSSYPIAYDIVFGVGATTQNDQRWENSSFGEVVDIYAPGKSLLTTQNDGGYTDNFSGTSLACPQVSGTVADMLQANPELTPEQIYGILTESGDEIVIDKGTVKRLNARRAVERAIDSIPEGIEEIVNQNPFDVNYQQIQSGNSIQLSYSGLNGEGATARLYDVKGARIDTKLISGGDGAYQLTFDGSELPNGMYFVELESNGKRQINKVVLVR